MTTALYRQIFKNNSYREKVKAVIELDTVIDHLISRDIVKEDEYLEIWEAEGDKLDSLFNHLNTKTAHVLLECFNIFKLLYGSDFERLLKDLNRDILDYIHLKGGFPKINKYIPRVIEETKIKTKFANIRWDNSLVVCGRVGEGKSFLVGECLKDVDLIEEHFDNHLYWINVGKCEDGSNILQPLSRLLKMVAPKTKPKDDLEELVEQLQNIFSSNKHRTSLVILDNARSLEVIDIFQRINCKLIIITYFKNVKDADRVEINSGFTLQETVSLFALYLETTTENLSNLLDDIKDIHVLCKGHPSTLALLAVILSCKKEHALASKEPWDYIKEKIDKGEIDDLGNNEVDIIRRKFNKALKMCIDTIETQEMKELYYQFAVFPKDANISAEVLEVFWDKDAHKVADIMYHFENRSLVNSFYNNKKKVYIYVIHDLFLNYLKNETNTRRREIHRKLIASYENKYGILNLPDDNYILLFLGYHLKQAEAFDKFWVFLDLSFISHKSRIVGVNNMEQDLVMYRTEIIKQNSETNLEDKIKFVKNNKNELRQLQKNDIVQLALPTLKDDAQILMFTNQANSINKLYFKIKLSAGRLKSSQEIFMKEEVTAMTFCTDSNVSKILIGLKNGEILLYCPQNYREFERFEGHKRPVFDIKVAHDNSCFLSVSKDRTVKLWQFYCQRLSLDGMNNVVSSPKCVQNEHFDAFSPGKRNNFKQFAFHEDKAYLISANFCNDYNKLKIICTGTNNGKVILWDTNRREKICATTETGFPIWDIYFSHDNSKILFSQQEKIQIYKYENDELSNLYESVYNIHDNEDIKRFFVADDKTLIAVGLRHVTMYKLPYENESSCIKVYESKDFNITCSAIAKGEYFAIGIKENVFLFEVSTGKHVETLEHKKVVTSIAMDVSRDDDNFTSMILMNFDDNHLHQCNIMMQHYGQPRNKQGLVTSYCKKNNLPLLALVYNDTFVRIQHEFSVINEVEQCSEITFITFSLCGNNIIFSLKNGLIKEYQYKRQGHFKNIAQLNDVVKYLQCFELSSLEANSEISYSSSDCTNGTIVAITDGEKKIHIIFEEGLIRSYSWDIPIFQVFAINCYHLLCIDESEGIFILDVMKNSDNGDLISYGTFGRKVIAAAFCPKNNLVAVTLIEQNHQTNHLEIIDLSSKETLRRVSLSYVPTCCAFSYLGGLLALGSEDGKIMVCDIQNNFKNTILSNTGLPIKYIEFSRSGLPILVAAGREVSWWNLKNFETDLANGNYASEYSTFDLKFWENKTVHDEIPNLLQTVSLYSNAIHFSVSRNFEMFVIVDDESRTYVMKCFKDVQ